VGRNQKIDVILWYETTGIYRYSHFDKVECDREGVGDTDGDYTGRGEYTVEV